ncbi:MAG: hypothetical protein COA95_00140 [Methylophaga sp.]|nr:MAG: hypothetical protein COA95_00140 [Methylophaga sp.]
MGIMKKTTGLAMAIAAASLVGCAATSTTANTASAEVVHCYGVTACKGHNDCKTAENACKGQAACKGHGFAAMSAEECAAAGGTEGA